MTNQRLVEALNKQDPQLEIRDSKGNVVTGVVIIVRGTDMYLQLTN